jgi:OPA family glycerol-3-phosphate transporter-like MFS transporter
VTSALVALSALRPDAAPWLTVGVMMLVAFALLGPYSYLAGAVALDFGGRWGSATSSGIIDGVGYLGGVLAGDTVARISVTFGWSGAFRALAGVAAASTAAAVVLLAARRRELPATESLDDDAPRRAASG